MAHRNRRARVQYPSFGRLTNLGGRPSAMERAGQNQISLVLASIIALLLSVRLPYVSWLTPGGVIAMAMAPVVLSVFLKQAGAVAILVGSLFTFSAGLVLADWSIAEGSTFSQRVAILEGGQLVGMMLIVVAACWCIRILGMTRFIIIWAVGYSISQALYSERFSEDIWKFGYALPATCLLLLIADRLRRRNLTLIIVLTIGTLSALASYRSWIMVVVIAFFLVAYIQWRQGANDRPISTLGAAIVIVGIGFSIGYSVLNLAISGLLGQSTQERTVEQIDDGGNIFIGGRPEWGAAMDLFHYNPSGYGLGIMPTTLDKAIALNGLAVNPALREQSGVAQYFRLGLIEFHSNLWNYWSHYGVIGVAFIVLLAILALKALIAAATNRTDFPSLTVAVIILGFIWDLAFSGTNIASQGVAIAVAMSAVNAERELAGRTEGFLSKRPTPGRHFIARQSVE